MSRQLSNAMRRLQDDLCEPKELVDIGTLQQLWRHDDIIITCTRPSGLEDQPDLAQRVRGALGNALELHCKVAPNRPDPFDRVSAHELLFFWPPTMVNTCLGQTEVAVPMVIRAEMIGSVVIVIVRLFGQARVYHPIVEAAAIMALNGGVSLRNHGIRVPFPVRNVAWYSFDGGAFEWLERASSVFIRYRTPVVIRAGKHLRLEPDAVLRSALRRVAALAPWMGFALDADAAALEVNIVALRYIMDIHPEQWTRFTKRAPDEPIVEYAYGGSMRVNGNLELILPYITLAQFTSVGGACASGAGAVDVTPCV